MNKRAFTLVELLATIIIIGVLGGLAVGAYYKYLERAREESFEMAEKTLINDVKNAYADCLSGSTNEFCTNHPDFGYEDEIIYLNELINTGYSEKIKNPYDVDNHCDSNSYIKVTANGYTGNNKDISYQVCLICGEQQSSTCD